MVLASAVADGGGGGGGAEKVKGRGRGTKKAGGSRKRSTEPIISIPPPPNLSFSLRKLDFSCLRFPSPPSLFLSLAFFVFFPLLPFLSPLASWESPTGIGASSSPPPSFLPWFVALLCCLSFLLPSGLIYRSAPVDVLCSCYLTGDLLGVEQNVYISGYA